MIAFVLELAWPVLRAALVGLGVGWITYTGLTTLIDTLRATVAGLLGGLPVVALQFATLGGAVEAVSIVLGGLAARAAVLAVGKLGRIVR